MPTIRYVRELRLAAKAVCLVLSARSTLPRDVVPVTEGKEMVVRARKMGRQDQCKIADRAYRRETAHFAATAGTKIAPTAWTGVTGT